MATSYTFTVFTPTYNRAYTLDRVYNSLVAQTFRDFEWLIVDDGSTDNTKELVEKWKQEAKFSIRYILQEHGGKHIAFNRGVQEAKGRLFLSFDSDDACVPEALECFKKYWDLIPEEEKENFAGVSCHSMNQNGTLIGDLFPQDVLDSDELELRYKYKVKGQKWPCFRTELLKQFPFPSKKGFFSEFMVWNVIAQKYKTRFFNHALLIYHLNESGRNDHLHKLGPLKGAMGFASYYVCVLNDQTVWFKYAPFEFFRAAVHFSRFSFNCGKNVLIQMSELENMLAKSLWMIMLPVGFLVSLMDKITVTVEHN